MISISGIKSMSMYNKETGKHVGTFDDEIKQIDFIGEPNISPMLSSGIKYNYSFEATGKMDDNLMRLLLGNPEPNKTKFDLEFIGEVKELEQIRKHKKKRINKKWAKKYGYKEIVIKHSIEIPFKNLEMIPHEDGTCEFFGDLCL